MVEAEASVDSYMNLMIFLRLYLSTMSVAVIPIIKCQKNSALSFPSIRYIPKRWDIVYSLASSLHRVSCTHLVDLIIIIIIITEWADGFKSAIYFTEMIVDSCVFSQDLNIHSKISPIHLGLLICKLIPPENVKHPQIGGFSL